MYISKENTLEETIKSIKELGICSTCIHLDGCVRNNAQSTTIWFCDEFDDTVLVDRKNGGSRQAAPEKKDYGTRHEVKGICANCDLLDECAYPKPAEGIWHCNEYV